MVDINWSILGQDNFGRALARGQQIGANALASFQRGQEIREGNDARKAFGEYASNPTPEGLNALAAYDPRFVMAERQRQDQQAAQQQQQRRVDMTDVAKLFNGVTPENYGQRLALAQQWGLDTSQAPQTFDPAWVAQQQVIVDAFVNDPQALPGLARELEAAGYQPGTPEFEQAMRGVINNKYASEYIDENGNTRRRSALNLPGAAPQAGPQPGAIEDGYRFKGGNPADPNAWEPVNQGGPQVAPAGGFPGY